MTTIRVLASLIAAIALIATMGAFANNDPQTAGSAVTIVVLATLVALYAHRRISRTDRA